MLSLVPDTQYILNKCGLLIQIISVAEKLNSLDSAFNIIYYRKFIE